MIDVEASESSRIERFGGWQMPFRSFGPFELILILVIVLLIFGVGKLPQVGEAMGKAVRQFRKSQEGSLEGDGAEEDKVKSDKTV